MTMIKDINLKSYSKVKGKLDNSDKRRLMRASSDVHVVAVSMKLTKEMRDRLAEARDAIDYVLTNNPVG